MIANDIRDKLIVYSGKEANYMDFIKKHIATILLGVAAGFSFLHDIVEDKKMDEEIDNKVNERFEAWVKQKEENEE